MFASPKENAKYYKALMLPDYDYITEKDRTILFNKKTWKATLGTSKSYDGWNFGYQCFNSNILKTFVNPYLAPNAQGPAQTFPYTVTTQFATPRPPLLKVNNLESCLDACKNTAQLPKTQTTLTTGEIGCCMYDPATSGCYLTPYAANMGYTGKAAAHLIFQ